MDVRFVDTSLIIDMSRLFALNKDFNQSIGNRDVSSVTYMNSMFFRSVLFNQPIDSWNVSNVRNIIAMFLSAESFNQPIGDWDVSNVTNMNSMFCNAECFSKNISKWNIKSVKSFKRFINHEQSKIPYEIVKSLVDDYVYPCFNIEEIKNLSILSQYEINIMLLDLNFMDNKNNFYLKLKQSNEKETMRVIKTKQNDNNLFVVIFDTNHYHLMSEYKFNELTMLNIITEIEKNEHILH